MKSINLSVGPCINGMGGVASVLRYYRQCGFLKEMNSTHIQTHTHKNSLFGLNIFILYAWGVIRVLYFHILYNVGIVHIHMSSRGSYIRKSFIIRLAKVFNSKVILHLHGGEFHSFYNHECSSKKKKHIRRTFEISDAIIVPSKDTLSSTQTIIKKPKKMIVIHNVTSKTRNNRANAQPGLVVFMGRLTKGKGIHDLITAFKKVRLHCLNAHLVLAGNGEIDEFKKKVNTLDLTDSVDFPGWLWKGEKESLLSKADIFCLPSYAETFSVGILEAMSRGIPVVASKAGGIPEAISHNKEGLLFDAGDTEALSAALISLIENRAQNTSQSEAAQDKFLNQLSPNLIMPLLSNLYKDLLTEDLNVNEESYYSTNR